MHLPEEPSHDLLSLFICPDKHVCPVQKLAKHAEPAANELSDRMEGGAHKFAKHAGPATKEFSDRAIDAAEDLSKNAAPKAHKVCPAGPAPSEHSCSH